MRLSYQHFWEWFKRNHQNIIALNDKPRKEMLYWINELSAHLRSYCKFLEYELRWVAPDHVLFTITVNGKSKLFKRVDALISKAPQVPGWMIRALDGARPIDYNMEEQIEKTGADPRELRFSFGSPYKRKESLVIYHPMCTVDNCEDFFLLARGAVYNLLGERQFGMEIGKVLIDEFILDPDLDYIDMLKEEVVYELESLPELLGMRQSVIRVDKQGNLMG